ncbi:hypothetical protein AQUCO_00400092v1 [Aquilegia coerulea]|uniref:FAD synthase n=1 Tax=Aquilegia coerulea TaxID=218851 RepID=A0A2G5ETE1_AQUCA|nr:hypothetical protein AQUCO_00400092v1 [Aquilegia coerulea]PIA58995.1 hypothetical protein AQUCO_00400092v1 [Aquilegia coerulea]
MATVPCRSTWVSLWGIRPQVKLRPSFRKTKLTSQYGQREQDYDFPSEGPVSVKGGIVALGKFDALHIGHRELAIQASKAGIPFLLSFVGMAEVLGWELRAPIVAKCDRKRVLSSWAHHCGSVAPAEFHVEFSSVRHLSPGQFVEMLANELGVRGVVAGENYRFGYKAAGDASELVKLCEEYGMEAYIVGSVMDKNQSPKVKSLDSKDRGQVSSTRVRCALANGDIRYVTELLGRSHRLVMVLSELEGVILKGNTISVPKSCFLNLPPKEGLYENCTCLIGETLKVPCSAMIDTTHLHVESTQQIPFQDCRFISIEFGSAEGAC